MPGIRMGFEPQVPNYGSQHVTVPLEMGSFLNHKEKLFEIYILIVGFSSS